MTARTLASRRASAKPGGFAELAAVKHYVLSRNLPESAMTFGRDHVLYHYSSREGCQGIIATGEIRPGPSGAVYFTDEVFTQGALAADRLSIVGKPVDLRSSPIAGSLGGLSIEGPYPVHPIRDYRGRLLRKGGGREYLIRREVPSPRDWVALDWP